MEEQPIFAIFALIIMLIFVAGLWSAINLFVSRVFGWHKISEQYWGQLTQYNKRFFMQTLATSFLGHYSGIVNIAVSNDYLGISVIFPYRIGHPPLKIPLEDISGVQKTTFIFPKVHLQLRKIPAQDVTISLRLAEKIEKASGGAWTFERPLS
ncbi:MAG: hypothetical protein DWQ04_29950 [Chloroflexi bacterium]|nr:MAG: hypothetical protein DWQ04_29950 [Chloroflexota bacterium]